MKKWGLLIMAAVALVSVTQTTASASKAAIFDPDPKVIGTDIFDPDPKIIGADIYDPDPKVIGADIFDPDPK